MRRSDGETGVEIREEIKRLYDVDVSLTTIYKWFRELKTTNPLPPHPNPWIEGQGPDGYKSNRHRIP